MKIRNSTAYETADLRRFAQKAFETLHVVPEHRAKYIVEFHYWRKGSHSRGWGLYGALKLACYLPRNPGELNLVQMASTFRHERAHNLNIRHREMSNDLRWCWPQIDRLGDGDWSWLWGFEIHVKQPKARPAFDDLMVRRLANAHARLKSAFTREKRAVTIRKKWQKRVKYYEEAAGRGPK